MPLHDWSELTGWDGVRLLWMAELQWHLKDRLPGGYRSYLGAGPALAIGGPPGRPDLSVRAHPSAGPTPPPPGATPDHGPADDAATRFEPEVELAVAVLDTGPTLFVEREGRLVAALELVSPRNKHRPSARDAYASRYAGYLIGGVHLLLIDVHRRPAGFSFADAISAELQVSGQPALPPPMAAGYRVGEPAAAGGRMLALWRKALAPGAALPVMPLPLAVGLSVPVDLEATYDRAAAGAYL